MPASVADELNRIMEQIMRGDMLEQLDDEIDEILKRKDLTFEEHIWAKLLLVESMLMIVFFGLDRYSFEECYKLAHEINEEYNKIENEYLKILSLMNLASCSFQFTKWKEGFEWYYKYKPIFDELEPSNELFYLKCKGMNYFFESTVPFFKALIGETSSERDQLKSFRLMEEGEQFGEKHGLNLTRMICLNNMAAFQYYAGNSDESLKIMLKLFEFTKETGNKLMYISGLDGLASAYFSLHDYKKYYDLQKERLVIVEELGYRNMLAGSYSRIGQYYSVTGSYEEALEYYKKCLDINIEFKNKAGIASTQQMIGTVYYLIGNLKKSIEYLTEAVEFFEEHRNQSLPRIFSEIASALQLTGELDKALEYLEKSMEIYEGLQNQSGICSILSEQGVIYWQKGIQDEAIALIKRSLDIALNIKDDVKISSNASYLVQFYLEQNAVDKAKEHLEIIEQISKKSKLHQVKFDLKFSTAIILKNSSNERDRIKAELLLEQLLEEDISYSLKVKVLLQLCSILLENLKETNNEEILERINSHVKALQDLSENNNSHILLVETLGLKAQLELIEFNFETAKSLLLKAQTVAQENDLDKLVLDILKQQENLTKQSIELNKLEKDKSTLASRMSVVKLEETVVNIKKTSISKTVSREEVSKKLLSIQI
ncbi:MAG: tetratricopeptide repeat protein [Candidatus Heimdallarchaeaceae archaeon]